MSNADRSFDEIYEPSEFERSLTEIKPKEIKGKGKQGQSLSDRLFRHARLGVLLICCLVLTVCLFYLGNTFINYLRTDRIYNSLDKNLMAGGPFPDPMFASPVSPLTPDYDDSQKLTDEDISGITGSLAVNRDFERMRNKLLDLKRQYPDVYGWVYIPNTTISYPIMQSIDNDYYLYRDYTGKYLMAGSIYADYHCDRDLLQNYNVVLYGHHMANNTMFHSLDKFFSEDFFYNNNKVYVYTLDGMFTYEVFSVYQTTMYYHYIRTIFQEPEIFTDFIGEMKENSLFPVEDFPYDATTRLLTLSTCNNRTEEGRIAVHAVMVDRYVPTK